MTQIHVPLGRKKHCKKDLSTNKTQYPKNGSVLTDPGLQKKFMHVLSGHLGQVNSCPR